MSLTLSQHLLNYAIESGEVEDPTQMGAEEITVITDETQSELEETVAEVAEVVEKLEENDAAAEKIVEAADSLESAVRRLDEMAGQNIRLAGPALQFYIQSVTTSLEARDIPAPIYKDAVLSMQHSFESAQVEDYTTEAKEKTESLIKRLYNMLVSAAKAAIQFITEFFATIGKNGAAITAAGKKLQGLAVKGDVEGEITGNYGALVVGGKVDPTAALKSLEKGYTSVKNLTREMQASIGQNGATAPSPMSVDLPGGAKVEFKLGEGKGLEKVAKASFSIKAADAKSEKSTPLDAAGIKALGGELVSIGNLMTAAVKDGKSITDAIQKFLSGVEGKLKSLVEKDEGAKKAAEDVKQARNALSGVKTYLPKYVKYMGGVAKQAYRFGIASAAKHKVAKEAATA